MAATILRHIYILTLNTKNRFENETSNWPRDAFCNI